ncbi:MAG: T9SS type A sorting domain-containing protein [Bacteroidia bacterium]
MKKLYLFITAIALCGSIKAQIITLVDSAQLITDVGIGSGGANISALHDSLTFFGFGDAVSTGYRVADEFKVPSPGWTIDTLIFYNYQTGSTTISTMNDLRVAIRNADPLVNPSPSTIVWGDSTTNVFYDSYWSGIYRVNDNTTNATNSQRPIMKNLCVPSPPLHLSAGTYWLDWQAGGTLTSGPWCPPRTLVGKRITGNGEQWTGTGWIALMQTNVTLPSAGQGLPFTIKGSLYGSGVQELVSSNSVHVFPNPIASFATVNISSSVIAEKEGFSFEMYDMMGNVVMKMTDIKSKSFTVNKGSLANGVYTYTVKNGTEPIKNGRIVIIAQ